MSVIEKHFVVTAKLFQHGSDQAVTLPEEFAFQADVVSIRRFGNGVLLEPIAPSRAFDVDRWFAEIDELVGEHGFMPEGRMQPDMPPDREFDL